VAILHDLVSLTKVRKGRLWLERFVAAGTAGPEGMLPADNVRDLRCPPGRQGVQRHPRTAAAWETHWSSRAVAERTGVSKTVTLRMRRDHELQPHRTGTFKSHTDAELEAKVIDVVGLYLHPPEKAW
jgi:hypothetical protein